MLFGMNSVLRQSSGQMNTRLPKNKNGFVGVRFSPKSPIGVLVTIHDHLHQKKAINSECESNASIFIMFGTCLGLQPSLCGLALRGKYSM